jgi:hypothetical protein
VFSKECADECNNRVLFFLSNCGSFLSNFTVELSLLLIIICRYISHRRKKLFCSCWMINEILLIPTIIEGRGYNSVLLFV